MKNLQLIIFGATGDLAYLKLFPSIYDMWLQKKLPEKFLITGFGRSDLSQDQFKKRFQEAVEKDYGKSPRRLNDLLKNVRYVRGTYDDAASFKPLKMAEYKENIAYYAVPPVVFESITAALAATFPKTQVKLVIEKPFGTDEKSAKHLFANINQYFDDEQVYLLDHYLGKRAIRSILSMRMENNIMNMMIAGQEVSNIQITAEETVSVCERIGYYDGIGQMKDMIQSHLLQVLAFITMNMPLNPTVESIQREKNNILSALEHSGDKKDLVFGQYESYRACEEVPAMSQTDTFAAMKLHINRREWYDVPVFIRTGKALSERVTRVVIEFEKMPFQDRETPTNRLIFEAKPFEKVTLQLALSNNELVDLTNSIACDIEQGCLTDYGNLLRDVINGDKSYFLSQAEICASWRLIDQISRLQGRPAIYKDGSHGPEKQYQLLKNWYE